MRARSGCRARSRRRSGSATTFFQVVEPGEKHWDIFKRLCIESDTRGSRVTDAWFAALAIEWGCEWITLDRDYARFPGLKWQLPAAGEGTMAPKSERG